MAYTTADRDAVKAALLQIATTGRPSQVRYADGSSVTYSEATVPQLQTVLAMVERDIAAALALTLGAPRMLRAIRMSPGSGF